MFRHTQRCKDDVYAMMYEREEINSPAPQWEVRHTTVGNVKLPKCQGGSTPVRKSHIGALILV